MKAYLKLVNFEFNRVAKLFTVLISITFVAQVAGVILLSRKYINLANESIYEDLVPKAEFLESVGKISFYNIANSLWFLGPIALCVAGVGFYIFLIWYRDWIGKNTFIYRLLMLPTARLNIFFAKITTILIMTFGLVALQLIFLPVEMLVMKGMVPSEFRTDMGVKELVAGKELLSIILPNSLVVFILYYGAGLLAVSILFTAILLERSFKWKGIFGGLIYIAAAVGLAISPVLLQAFVLNEYFYPIELFILEIIMCVLVLIASFWVSGFLLKKKITV